jgi:hypothetical protein
MREIRDIKVGDTIVLCGCRECEALFTGKEIFLEKDNFIRATNFNEAVLNLLSIGARCRITKIFQSTFGYDYEMITLDCPNGEYDFLMDVVGANFTRCPREVAFETLGL